jgi:hypothetical protein
MHVVERGIDEALVVGDVIVRILEISGRDNEVRVAISSPNGGPRYQEVVLRVDGSDEFADAVGQAALVVNC